jgi:hypothetical protein
MRMTTATEAKPQQELASRLANLSFPSRQPVRSGGSTQEGVLVAQRLRGSRVPPGLVCGVYRSARRPHRGGGGKVPAVPARAAPARRVFPSGAAPNGVTAPLAQVSV